MANPNPSASTRFKSGSSGNPLGSSQRARVLGKLCKMQACEIAEVGTALLQGTVAELEEVRDDPAADVLDRWLAALISQAMQKGDASVFKVVLDRLVGKASEGKATESAAAADPRAAHIESMTYAEKLAEIDRLRRLRLELGDD